VARFGLHVRLQQTTLSTSISTEKDRFLKNLFPVDRSTEFFPDDWLSYSSYQMVALEKGEWESLDGGVRHALITFARNGGVLVLMSSDGAGAADLSTLKFHAQNGIQAAYPGLGAVLITGKNADQLSQDEKRFLAETLLMSRPRTYDPSTWREILKFEGPRTEGLNSLALIVFLLLLIMGPGNYFLMRRIGKPVWIIWSVPLSALVITAGLSGYVRIAEGNTIQISQLAVTILDEASQRATTKSIGGIYTPVNPRRPARFSPHVNAQPKEYIPMRSGLTLDWSNELSIEDWVFPRGNLYFTTVGTERRRERLDFSRDGDAVSVVNGFGTPIDKLIYKSAGGDIYTGEALDAGAKITLKSITRPRDYNLTAYPHPNHIREATMQFWAGHSDPSPLFHGRYYEHIPPGGYIAVLSKSPFVEMPFEPAEVNEVSSVVIGIGEDRP
jgi:hypothetical protein